MSCDIYLINKDKKEFVRTKANGEDKDYVVKFLSDNQGETIHIRGENSNEVEDILYTEKGNEYKEIDICSLLYLQNNT